MNKVEFELSTKRFRTRKGRQSVFFLPKRKWHFYIF